MFGRHLLACNQRCAGGARPAAGGAAQADAWGHGRCLQRITPSPCQCPVFPPCANAPPPSHQAPAGDPRQRQQQRVPVGVPGLTRGPVHAGAPVAARQVQTGDGEQPGAGARPLQGCGAARGGGGRGQPLQGGGERASSGGPSGSEPAAASGGVSCSGAGSTCQRQRVQQLPAG